MANITMSEWRPSWPFVRAANRRLWYLCWNMVACYWLSAMRFVPAWTFPQRTCASAMTKTRLVECDSMMLLPSYYSYCHSLRRAAAWS